MSGAVLAGGRSSRFGSDKSSYFWRGQTLLEWAQHSLAHLPEVQIIGGTQPNAVTEAVKFAGALYGLALALESTKAARVAVMACDMPNLSREFWLFMAQFHADVVIAKNATGHLEPLAAIYTRRCLPWVQSALANSDLRLNGWWQISDLTVQIVTWEELELFFTPDLFLNANTPTDLA